MSLPRFDRLPAARREHILGVARKHLARDGEQCSYNAIIAEAGISKTSAYLYFDGKDDLTAEVYRDLARRLRAVIGAWQPCPSPDAFWSRLESTSLALQRHLAEHPEDARLLTRPGALNGAEEFDRTWFTDLVRDGQRLHVVRQDVQENLVVDATRALFRVFDLHALREAAQGGEWNQTAAFVLLRSMWRPSLDETKTS